MILNAHKYFSEENSSSKKRQKFTLRKRVAEVLGVSESTVGRVIHKQNECKNGSKVIVKLWKKALNNAKGYKENDEHVYLSNEETDDESFSEDNMESSE